jgi:hypothetical protein
MQQAGGPRYDGRSWPAAGEEFDVPAWEADEITRADPHQSVPLAALVRGADGGGPEIKDGQWTVPAADSGPEEKTTEVAEPLKATVSPAGEPKAPAHEHEHGPGQHVPADRDNDEEKGTEEPRSARTGSPAAVTSTVESPVEAPASSAPKQDWVAYAVSQGADPHEAGSMTKADLMSRHGGRPGSE